MGGFENEEENRMSIKGYNKGGEESKRIGERDRIVYSAPANLGIFCIMYRYFTVF